MKPLLGLTQRMTVAAGSGEKRDCLAQDWSQFLLAIGVQWIALPNHAETAIQLARELGVTGLVLTGGDDIGVFPERDDTERRLIEDCMRRNIPILGVCRGLQVLHWYFGGTLRQVSSDMHVAKRHMIAFEDGSSRVVNSYHNNGIVPSVLPNEYPLRFIAICSEDKSIEAAAMDQIVGIMWHPEREATPIAEDVALFQRHFNISEKGT